MIEFRKTKSHIFLEYYPDGNAISGSQERDTFPFPLKRTFFFLQDDVDLVETDSGEEMASFIFASLKDNYFKVPGRILEIEHDLYIDSTLEPSIKWFYAPERISIIKKVSRIVEQDIYIGGEHENAIEISDFNNLIRNFPTSREVNLYRDSRISTILTGYFEGLSKETEKYERYLNKKPSKIGFPLSKEFRNLEKEKFGKVLQKLETMLESPIGTYNEAQWQTEIAEIILLLYPKYIRVFKEAPVKVKDQKKPRRIDLLLIDAQGHADILEIKKPYEQKIVSRDKYRNNHVPLRELSGSIMQVEKYIYYLNKSGETGEDALTSKYKKHLPTGMEIKVVNPLGIVIVGRDNNLTKVQKADFEVIKRKYKNIVDIVTYDDLVKRLRFLVESFDSNQIVD